MNMVAHASSRPSRRGPKPPAGNPAFQQGLVRVLSVAATGELWTLMHTVRRTQVLLLFQLPDDAVGNQSGQIDAMVATAAIRACLLELGELTLRAVPNRDQHMLRHATVTQRGREWLAAYAAEYKDVPATLIAIASDERASQRCWSPVSWTGARAPR